MAALSGIKNLLGAVGKTTKTAAVKTAKGVKTVEKAAIIGSALGSLVGGSKNGKRSLNERTGPNLSINYNNQTKEQTLSKEDIVFIKNDYRPEKIQQKEIFKRLLKESNISKEIGMTNQDIVLALYNINEVSKINSKIPKINTSLFKDMLSQFLIKNKTESKPNEKLKDLSITQEKIYKILFKIEDELIDEQDTAISEAKNRERENSNFLERLENLLKNYNAQTISDEKLDNDSQFPSFLSAGGLKWLLPTLMKPFKWVFNQAKNIISGVAKGIGKGFEKVGQWISKAFPNLSKFASSAWNGIKNAFSKVGTKIGSATAGASKILDKLGKGTSNALQKVVGKIGNNIFKIIDLIMLGTYIANYYHNAEKSFDEPGCIEKLLFSVISGITQWVQEQIEFLEFLSDLIPMIFDLMSKFFNVIVDFIMGEDSTIGNAFKTVFKLIVDVFPINPVCKYIISPVIEWIKKNGTFGADCGVIAIEIYREFKHEFTNAIPNKSTLKLLFGTDEYLERVQKKGLYTWNKMGESKIMGSAEDLAKLATVTELEKILEHDDIDSFDRKKVKDAIAKIKTGDPKYNNEKLKNGEGDQILISLVENDNMWEKCASKISYAFAIMWKGFADKSSNIIMSSPEKCLIEFHYDNGDGKPGTLTPKTVIGASETGVFFGNDYDLPKSVIELVINALNKLNTGFKLDHKTDHLHFTPYGTFFSFCWEGDTLKAESIFKSAKKKHKKSTNGGIYYYKIIGHFNQNGEFKKNEIANGDKCVEKICGVNVVTDSEIIEEKAIAKHIEMSEVKNEETTINTVPIEKPEDFTNIGTSNSVRKSNPNSKIPRGIRNNNPGNVRYNGIQWYGITGSDGAFCVFSDPIYGIRAMARCIYNQQGNASSTTIKDIINAYTPSSENDTNSYIKTVCSKTGFSPNEQINLKDPDTLFKIIAAMIGVESGYNPYTEDQIRKGVNLSLNMKASLTDVSPTKNASDIPSDIGVSKTASDIPSDIGVSKTASEGPSSDLATDTVPQNTQNSPNVDMSTIEMAANYARKHAHNSSIGYCGRYVANALQAVGFKFARQGSAYMFHTKGILKGMGFGLVSQGQKGYAPQKGDVCVINRFGSHEHGHICIYDGKNWISDFVQRNPSPYKDYPGEKNMLFYRYGGPDLGITPTDSYTQVDNFSGMESYSPTYSSSNTATNRASTSASVNKNGNRVGIEYEGQSENLFNIKYNEVLI